MDFKLREEFKFTEQQLTDIVNKVVPIIAAPEDHEFFKGVILCYAEDHNHSQFSAFIEKLLKQVA